jgi:hypothetical protein
LDSVIVLCLGLDSVVVFVGKLDPIFFIRDLDSVELLV